MTTERGHTPTLRLRRFENDEEWSLFWGEAGSSIEGDAIGYLWDEEKARYIVESVNKRAAFEELLAAAEAALKEKVATDHTAQCFMYERHTDCSLTKLRAAIDRAREGAGE